MPCPVSASASCCPVSPRADSTVAYSARSVRRCRRSECSRSLRITLTSTPERHEHDEQQHHRRNDQPTAQRSGRDRLADVELVVARQRTGRPHPVADAAHGVDQPVAVEPRSCGAATTRRSRPGSGRSPRSPRPGSGSASSTAPGRGCGRGRPAAAARSRSPRSRASPRCTRPTSSSTSRSATCTVVDTSRPARRSTARSRATSSGIANGLTM